MGERLNVNPTRIQLKTLSHRLQVARRGHKMLKDKNDELIRNFTSLAKNCKRQRKKVEKEFLELIREYMLNRAYLLDSDIERLFLGFGGIEIKLKTKNILNIFTPHIECQIDNESNSDCFIDRNLQLDKIALKLRNFMPVLCKQAELEKSVFMLSREIERNKRRVNALEFLMIPRLEETIKYIKFKLEEQDRSSRIRLIKFKDSVR